MVHGKYLSLEEASKRRKLDQFAKENPSQTAEAAALRPAPAP